MKTIKFIAAILLIGISSYSFTFLKNNEGEDKIKWMSFKQALELSKKEKKKIFIDVYTDWCGWCKVTDKNTFTNPVIVKYMNEHYYAVKLNAEMKDTIMFKDHAFVNPYPNSSRSTHQLAASLLNNELSYPTTIYLDENFNMLTKVPGYLQPAQMEPIMKYFGENAYPNTKWEDYQKAFKSGIPPAEQKQEQVAPH